MLIYKQRYKPRTSREFTKSDMTVYDSAGNTALNALTVYGKSEVVSGSIVSVGEGWGTVDLGAQDWTYVPSALSYPVFSTTINGIAHSTTPLLCEKYAPKTNRTQINGDLQIARWNNASSNEIVITDFNYTDATGFKNAMSGVLLCYELADNSQGNAIAVKTDNGTGVDGTMGVFKTGTPLYGISDTVRDFMEWDGSTGTVTKNCGKDRLADLTWIYDNNRQTFYTTDLTNIVKPAINFNSVPNLFIDGYTVVTPNQVLTATGNMRISAYHYANDDIVMLRNTAYTTVSDFVASLGDSELIYELATPTTTPLTTAENASIAGLRTFSPQTHAQNNAQADMTIDYTIRVPTI